MEKAAMIDKHETLSVPKDSAVSIMYGQVMHAKLYKQNSKN